MNINRKHYKNCFGQRVNMIIKWPREREKSNNYILTKKRIKFNMIVSGIDCQPLANTNSVGLEIVPEQFPI